MGRTTINISNNNPRPLIRKQSRDLCPDALAAAGDEGGLVGEEAAGVVELVGELGEAVGHFIFLLCPIFFWF